MRRPILVAIGVGIAVAISVAVVVGQNIMIPQNKTTPQIVAVPEAQTHKTRVIASFYPLYEFSRNVGGSKVEVSSFIPIGVEPHDWEPSSGDLISLKGASVFVYNGVGIESFVDKLINSGEYNTVDFVDTSNGVNLIQSTESESKSSDEQHLSYDPHIWLDPIIAKQQVIAIKDALVKADPTDSEYYTNNANSYNAKLDELDAKIKDGLTHCKKETFVSFHNAFSYFAARYGINSVPLTGISPEAEPTAAQLKDFVDYVKTNDIKVIFAEELVNPRLAEVLADEAGAQVMILSPLEGLSDEDMKSGKSYIDKMEENLEDLRVALECQ